MRAKPWLVGLALLVVAACASPREKAYQQAVRDYKRKEADAAAYARASVKQLVTATRTFRSSIGRWPQTYVEFGRFVLANGVSWTSPPSTTSHLPRWRMVVSRSITT